MTSVMCGSMEFTLNQLHTIIEEVKCENVILQQNYTHKCYTISSSTSLITKNIEDDGDIHIIFLCLIGSALRKGQMPRPIFLSTLYECRDTLPASQTVHHSVGMRLRRQ